MRERDCLRNIREALQRISEQVDDSTPADTGTALDVYGHAVRQLKRDVKRSLDAISANIGYFLLHQDDPD